MRIELGAVEIKRETLGDSFLVHEIVQCHRTKERLGKVELKVQRLAFDQDLYTAATITTTTTTTTTRSSRTLEFWRSLKLYCRDGAQTYV